MLVWLAFNSQLSLLIASSIRFSCAADAVPLCLWAGFSNLASVVDNLPPLHERRGIFNIHQLILADGTLRLTSVRGTARTLMAFPACTFPNTRMTACALVEVRTQPRHLRGLCEAGNKKVQYGNDSQIVSVESAD